MIEIEDLMKSYNGTPALQGFSLQVGAGELFGLVGPNGAGKTTLIKVLATLIRPDAGQARIDQHNVTLNPQAIRPLVGYLPDVPGLYHDLRVEEYLEFFADAFRIKGEQKRAAIAQALEQSGLGDRRSAFVEQLSFGLKQRLVLAKTQLHSPKVLLLDEPATGLDPMARIELRDQLKELNRQGTTILISSHILSDLEDVCTRVAFISAGRNAADQEGRTIVTMRKTDTIRLTCVVEVAGEAQQAAELLKGFAEGRVLEAEGQRLLVEVAGTEAEAASLLRFLVTSGVAVTRFDSRGPGLEDHYRRTFAGKKQ